MKVQESTRSAQVFIEIGHRAWRRELKDQTPGKTHDWVLFVKGKDDNKEIHHFIEKVVFYLHESFEKPTQVVREPPYMIAESGYGIFMAKIEVYFRMKEKEGQSKQLYGHDITLPSDGQPPIELELTEKLTFNNVSESFIQKVLKGGGTLINNNEDHDAMATKQQKDIDYKLNISLKQMNKKPRKHQEASTPIPSISPDSKNCSKEIERRQLAMAMFGAEPEMGTKKIKSEEITPSNNTDKDFVLKKKSQNPEHSKVKNRKSSGKPAVKDIKLDSKPPSSNENKIAYKSNKKSKLDHLEQMEMKIIVQQKESNDPHEENLVPKKKNTNKPLEISEEMSSEESENQYECEKDSSINETETKLVALSGLPYDELEMIHSKITSLNPDVEEELELMYEIFKLLRSTGKGYEEAETSLTCFNIHHVELPILLQIKEILHL